MKASKATAPAAPFTPQTTRNGILGLVVGLVVGLGLAFLLEPFRTLRSSMQYFSVEKKSHVWLVTSGLPQEGKTITSVNLALSSALSGKRTILAEGDLRHPMVHEYLGLDLMAGLSDVLAGAQQATDVLQLVKADDFLPSEDRRQPG